MMYKSYYGSSHVIGFFFFFFSQVMNHVLRLLFVVLSNSILGLVVNVYWVQILYVHRS